MNNVPLVIGILRRGLERSLLLELVLLVAVATSIMFFGGLILKRPVDGLLFMSRAAFDGYATDSATSSPADAVIVLPRFPVVRDNGRGGLGFTPEMQTVEVNLVPKLFDFATNVLGENAPAVASGLGVLVDEDTARRLGVGVGDRIVLNAAVLGGDPMPALEVVGLMRPYSSIRSRGETGLVVVEASSLPETFVEGVAPLVLPDDAPTLRRYGEPGPDVTTRERLGQQFLAQLFGQDVIAATLAVFIFAGSLWLASLTRMLNHLLRRLRHPCAVLLSLGVGPRTLRATIVIAASSMTFIAIVAGGTISSGVLFPNLLQMTLQPPTLVPVGVVVGLATILPTALALAQLSGRLQGVPLHETLAAGAMR
jgi:hypothetical protein